MTMLKDLILTPKEANELKTMLEDWKKEIIDKYFSKNICSIYLENNKIMVANKHSFRCIDRIKDLRAFVAETLLLK